MATAASFHSMRLAVLGLSRYMPAFLLKNAEVISSISSDLLGVNKIQTKRKEELCRHIPISITGSKRILR